MNKIFFAQLGDMLNLKSPSDLDVEITITSLVFNIVLLIAVFVLIEIFT